MELNGQIEPQNLIVNSENDVEQIMKPMLRWLNVEKFRMHFLSSDHLCAELYQHDRLQFLWDGNHPIIKIIYVKDEQMLAKVNIIHRAYRSGDTVNTWCPVCNGLFL